MEELPTDFDVIVVGTGLTGSIVAAALSRVGKAVLHIDENDFYGEEFASFNLDTIEDWLRKEAVNSETVADVTKCIQDLEKFVPVVRSRRCSNIKQNWVLPKDVISDEVEENTDCKIVTTPSGENDKEVFWTQNKMKSEHRKFNLDLSPRILYSRGDLVELLISSNIARYAEFRCVSRVLTWRNEQLEVVPCSRADVFATRHVSVVQKRMLVKILTQFAEYPKCLQEFKGFENKTFVEYLKHKKIDDQLIHYIVYAIAMGDHSTPCLDGVASCQRFLQSLGRYSNSPFICTMYGAGDLPQCFCRLCAVFGGLYHLQRTVDGFIINAENSILGIVSGGQRLNATYFVFTSNLCPPKFHQPQPENVIYRAIHITDRSLVASEKEAVTLLQFPPRDATEKPVTVIEMGGACFVSPRDLFVIHLTTESKDADGGLLEHVKKTLLVDAGDEGAGGEGVEKPRVLWSLSWRMRQTNIVLSKECPTNLKIFGGPDSNIDYDFSVNEAKEIFKSLYPDEDFLPRAPDPEEILFDDPEPTQVESDSKDPISSNEEISQEESTNENLSPVENTAEPTLHELDSKKTILLDPEPSQKESTNEN